MPKFTENLQTVLEVHEEFTGPVSVSYECELSRYRVPKSATELLPLTLSNAS